MYAQPLNSGYFQLLSRLSSDALKQLHDNRYIWLGFVASTLTRAPPQSHIKRTRISHASIVLIDWTTHTTAQLSRLL